MTTTSMLDSTTAQSAKARRQGAIDPRTHFTRDGVEQISSALNIQLADLFGCI